MSEEAERGREREMQRERERERDRQTDRHVMTMAGGEAARSRVKLSMKG